MKTGINYCLACITVGGLGLFPTLLSAHGADAADLGPPRFVERPGSLEFSGQMIIRPLQPAALGEHGLGPERIEVIRKRATARIDEHVIEYVTQTDEYLVNLPANETENSYAARLMTTGDYEYAVPNWICHPTETIPNDGGYDQQWHHSITPISPVRSSRGTTPRTA